MNLDAHEIIFFCDLAWLDQLEKTMAKQVECDYQKAIPNSGLKYNQKLALDTEIIHPIIATN